jgi:hypothetical protein
VPPVQSVRTMGQAAGVLFGAPEGRVAP